jgi:diadenosine tetraphosphate (Ap4A) HIT family hydrolase
MSTIIHQRVEEARAGTNPHVICRVASGWVVLGDSQFLRGYSLLLPDPVVPDLNALNTEQRIRYLQDMVIIGDALLEVTDTYRINYEILGNTAPVLHAHIFPRYMSEPEERRKTPAWLYDAEHRQSITFDIARDRQLMRDLEQVIKKRI